MVPRGRSRSRCRARLRSCARTNNLERQVRGVLRRIYVGLQGERGIFAELANMPGWLSLWFVVACMIVSAWSDRSCVCACIGTLLSDWRAVEWTAKLVQ